MAHGRQASGSRGVAYIARHGKLDLETDQGEAPPGKAAATQVVNDWGIGYAGFAILDRLRSRFEHVTSFLMDRDTLMAHEAHWGEEKKEQRVLHDLPRLTGDERALFDDLRDDCIHKRLRLEQERVGFGWVADALRRFGGDRDWISARGHDRRRGVKNANGL